MKEVGIFVCQGKLEGLDLELSPDEIKDLSGTR